MNIPMTQVEAERFLAQLESASNRYAIDARVAQEQVDECLQRSARYMARRNKLAQIYAGIFYGRKPCAKGRHCWLPMDETTKQCMWCFMFERTEPTNSYCRVIKKTYYWG